MKWIFVLRKSTFKLVQLTNQTYTAGNKIVHSWLRTDHCWRNDLFQETRKAIGRYNSWNVELLLARSGDAHVLPANRTMVETSNRVWLFVVLSAYFSALSRPYPLRFLHADPPQREKQLSLTHFLSFSRPDRLARTCFHQTTNRSLLQTAYSPATRLTAYSQLPHHQLHSPRHSFPPPVAP